MPRVVPQGDASPWGTGFISTTSVHSHQWGYGECRAPLPWASLVAQMAAGTVVGVTSSCWGGCPGQGRLYSPWEEVPVGRRCLCPAPCCCPDPGPEGCGASREQAGPWASAGWSRAALTRGGRRRGCTGLGLPVPCRSSWGRECSQSHQTSWQHHAEMSPAAAQGSWGLLYRPESLHQAQRKAFSSWRGEVILSLL